MSLKETLSLSLLLEVRNMERKNRGLQSARGAASCSSWQLFNGDVCRRTDVRVCVSVCVRLCACMCIII